MDDKLTILLIILVLLLSPLQHELAHKEIYKRYGVESKIILTPTTYQTVVDDTTQLYSLTNEELIDLNKLHLLNDIIAYNLLMVALPIILLLTLILLELKDRKTKN